MTPLPCFEQMELAPRYARPLDEIRRDWIESAARRVPVMFDPGTEFSSDDLHAKLGDPPVANWVGVLAAKLRNEGMIEPVGYRKSERRSANGRVLSVWRLKA